MINNIVTKISNINGVLNNLVWGIPMLCLILGTGIYFTIRTKFFQITHAKDVYNNTLKGIFVKNREETKEERKKHTLTQFQALSTALASTIGTGNIAGVATAIVVGGPGSIFWMWICAIFGMITHFAEIILGIYYRNYDEKVGYSGGPMYYLENGLGKDMHLKTLGKFLAILFATFTFLASFGIGNMTQINSIAEAINTNFGVPMLIIGIFLAVVAALIIIGGITRIGQVAEKIVPIMAAFYLIVGIIICILNYKNIPLVFISIFSGAFNFKAIAGGVFGIVIKRAITYGFKRGAFSNEAGLGSSVIAHSASNTIEPVKQAFWGIFEVFFDTIVVCTFTSLIVLSSSLKAPSLDTALKNLTNEEQIVCIDDSLINDDGEVLLVDNNYYMMPIKVDSSNNAICFEEKPNDGKNYIEIVSYGKTYYVEELMEKDANENSYFFGNVLKIKANPIMHTNNEPLLDDKGLPIIDSINVRNVNGVSLVTLAVSNKLTHWAGKILAIAVTLFAFTTVLGWSYYGTKTIEYIFGKIGTIIYKGLFILFVVVGATMNLNLAWDIADTLNGFMAIPNLIGVLLLSKVVLDVIKNYFDRQSGKDVKPMINYKG